MYLCCVIIMNGISEVTESPLKFKSKPFCCCRKAFYIPTRIAPGLLRASSKIGLSKGDEI